MSRPDPGGTLLSCSGTCFVLTARARPDALWASKLWRLHGQQTQSHGPTQILPTWGHEAAQLLGFNSGKKASAQTLQPILVSSGNLVEGRLSRGRGLFN